MRRAGVALFIVYACCKKCGVLNVCYGMGKHEIKRIIIRVCNGMCGFDQGLGLF